MKNNFRIAAAIALVFFVISLFALTHVYAVLTIAFVLAYLLDPLVGALEKRGVRRELAAPATLIVFFSVVVLAGLAIIPRFFEQARVLVKRLPAVYHGVAGWLTPVSEKYLGYNAFEEVDKFVASLGDPSTVVSPIGGLLGGVFAKTFGIVTAVLGTLVIPLMAYYLLRELPELWGRFLYLVPKRHHKAAGEIRTRLHGVLGGFLRGQLVVSSILSLYYAVAFMILRMDLALVLGLMAGFFNVVPYLGIVSVFVLTMLIALIHGATAAKYIGVAVVFAVGMGIEGSFLTPRIVGRRVGLSPLVLIVSLLVGSELMGLVGMLLAVPIAAIGKVFLSFAVEKYHGSEMFKRGS